MTPLSPYQFGLFRIVLGLGMACYFLGYLINLEDIIAHSPAADPTNHPLWRYLPVPLAPLAHPVGARIWIGLGTLLAIVLTSGIARRLCAILLILVWLPFWSSYAFAVRPVLPVFGFLLLFCAIARPGEALKLTEALRPGKGLNQLRHWSMPRPLVLTAWLLLLLAYFALTLVYLQNPQWRGGVALESIAASTSGMQAPFASAFLNLDPELRLIINRIAIALPPLFLLLMALPLASSRLVAWSILLATQILTLLFITIDDTVLGLIAAHILVFHPAWLPPRRHFSGSPLTVFYDGECMLCNRSVQRILNEDHHDNIQFAPLQGQTAKSLFTRHPDFQQDSTGLSSIIAVEDLNGIDENPTTKSSAVIHILHALGGFWGVLANLLKLIPPPLRNMAYTFIANNRFRWFGKATPEACALPDPDDARKILP